MKVALAVACLLLIVAVPFWFATRPFKDPKKRISKDNLTDDRVSHNSQTLD
jgi:hypothetical protein